MPSTTTSEGGSAIEITPNEHDFTPIHDRMASYIERELIPFAITAVLRGTDVLHVAYQAAEGEATAAGPIGPDSILRMHSSTKLATSVLAMTFHEEGRFSLDDPVADHLPEFGDPRVLRADATSVDDVEPADGPILVRHVLSHSAGLSYGFMEPDAVIDRAYEAAGLGAADRRTHTLASLCETMAALPLAYQPGTGWRYSFATDVVARLTEVLGRKPFDELMRERVLDPLGMDDTGFWVPPDKVDRLTTIHLPADPLDPTVPGLSPMPTEANDGPPTFLSGGGGFYSTFADYLAFIRMLVGGGEWNGVRILEPATIELMRTNQLAPGVGVTFPGWHMPDTTFGLGFALKEAPAGGEPSAATGEYHWGGMGGTHFWMAPRPGIAGICLTQRMPGFWHPFSRDFKRLAYAALSPRLSGAAGSGRCPVRTSPAAPWPPCR